MRKYQKDFASTHAKMYETKSREEKGLRIIKTIENFIGKENSKNISVLDVGASTGIIDNILAKKFKKVTGTDIDFKAIKFAKKNFKRKNLTFKVDDAMKLSSKDNSIDVVICTHVYEHVPSPKKLFSEIHRVLKPGGVCYLAAQNKLWPLEAHHHLWFLSYLPKSLADKYIKLFRGKDEYYEHPMNYWQLKKTVREFKIHDYTSKILKNPEKFGYSNPSIGVASNFLTYFTPTMFWILEK